MTKVCENCGGSFQTSHAKQKYCRIACMPREIKQAAGRKARAKFTATFRMKRFGRTMARLPQRLTREDLFIVFQEIYTRGYQAGHRQARVRDNLKAKVA